MLERVKKWDMLFALIDRNNAEDGTLIITSYKGLETDVTIPDQIGKTAVTAIDKDAFNPEAPRLTEMQKKHARN